MEIERLAKTCGNRQKKNEQIEIDGIGKKRKTHTILASIARTKIHIYFIGCVCVCVQVCESRVHIGGLTSDLFSFKFLFRSLAVVSATIVCCAYYRQFDSFHMLYYLSPQIGSKRISLARIASHRNQAHSITFCIVLYMFVMF